MRRIAGFVLAIFGLVFLVGSRYLDSLPASAYTSGSAPGSLAAVTLLGSVLGVAFIAFGLRTAFRPNMRGPSLGTTVARTARRAIIQLVVVIIIFAIALGVGFVVLANGSPTTKQAIMDALFECRTQSHRFAPASVGFSVDLPGTDIPTDKVDSVSGGTTSLPLHQYTTDCGLDSYYVAYIDLPAGTGSGSADPKGTLQSGLSAVEAGNTLVSSKDVTLGSSYPGLQFVIEEPSKSIISKTETIYGAVYLVNDRLYEVFVGTPSSTYSETRDASFLQSFNAS